MPIILESDPCSFLADYCQTKVTQYNRHSEIPGEAWILYIPESFNIGTNSNLQCCVVHACIQTLQAEENRTRRNGVATLAVECHLRFSLPTLLELSRLE